MSNKRHQSFTADWITPPEIIDAARATLGVIDLDPASSGLANKIVRATRYYGVGSAVENGFTTEWSGRVFLNPPGGRCDERGVRVVSSPGKRGLCYADGSTCEGPARSAAKLWWERLVGSWATAEVTAAIFLGFSVEILQTTQVHPGAEFVPLEFPLCFPSSRLAFLSPTGEGEPLRGNTHASVIVLLPDRSGGSARVETIERFVRAFRSIGFCTNVAGK
jgi:hypothetical protein